jgi:hypothetical protein
MKRKPIKIDWDALEEAFSRTRQEAASYLDRITGRIILEGEGEDADPDEGTVAPAVPASTSEDPTRLPIRPPDIPRKVAWMMSFLRQTADEHPPEVDAEIKAATELDDPTPAVKAILNRNPEVRDAWYVYRSERIQEMIVAWLAEHGIETTDPPPWAG